MLDVKKISDEADVIINGYAIKKNDSNFYVYNLNNEHGVSLFNNKYELIESNMDDIEITISKNYLLESLKFIEVQ